MLDVGAGKGAVSNLVQRIGNCEVYALDSNKKRIALIQRKFPNLKTCLSGSESIPFPDGFFNKIFSTLAVHHFGNQEKAIREFGRVLRPGGVLVIVEMSPRKSMGRLARFFENRVLRSHLTFLDIGELMDILKRHGVFDIKENAQGSSYYFVQAVRQATPHE